MSKQIWKMVSTYLWLLFVLEMVRKLSSYGFSHKHCACLDKMSDVLKREILKSKKHIPKMLNNGWMAGAEVK